MLENLSLSHATSSSWHLETEALGTVEGPLMSPWPWERRCEQEQAETFQSKPWGKRRLQSAHLSSLTRCIEYICFLSKELSLTGGSDGRVCLQCERPSSHPWVGKIPWRREWLPTLVFLPGEFHGQRSLAGYSPWGCKKPDMTEWLTLSLSSNWTHCTEISREVLPVSDVFPVDF